MFNPHLGIAYRNIFIAIKKKKFAAEKNLSSPQIHDLMFKKKISES